MRTKPTLLTLLLPAIAALLALACASEQRMDEGLAEPTAFAVVTAPLPGSTALDAAIRSAQQRVVADADPSKHLERLGWILVEKARTANDAGYYRLTLSAAAAIEEREGDPAAAALLRGHALHALHRFEEAEGVARALVEKRGIAYDFGLLGDVLLDRGDVAGATGAYQRLMDLKPDSRAFSRAAQLRFIVGDVEGAVIAMATAARSVSPRRPAAFGTTWAQLARYQLEFGLVDAAIRTADRALVVHPESGAAWFQRGRALLARGEAFLAVRSLRRAARSTPTPEIRWTLSEALDEAGDSEEAQQLRSALRSEQGSSDPRSLALFLASRGGSPTRAIDLAQRELVQRRDVHTWGVLAWAQRAGGQLEAARDSMEHALAEGTRDARLFFQAGVIAAESGNTDEAVRWLSQAGERRHALLPSERAALESFLYPPHSSLSSTRLTRRTNRRDREPTNHHHGTIQAKEGREDHESSSTTILENRTARSCGELYTRHQRGLLGIEPHGRTAHHSRRRREHDGCLRIRRTGRREQVPGDGPCRLSLPGARNRPEQLSIRRRGALRDPRGLRRGSASGQAELLVSVSLSKRATRIATPYWGRSWPSVGRSESGSRTASTPT